MFPIVHPPLAYILFASTRILQRREPPTGGATLMLLIGAILPDLIDQPLYILFELPSTRTVGHSLFTAIPVCLAVYLVVRKTGLSADIVAGFCVGYGSHLAADAFWPLILWEPNELGFLLWPITPSPAYEGIRPLGDLFGLPMTTLWIELPLFALGTVWWWRDGKPGLNLLRTTVRNLQRAR